MQGRRDASHRQDRDWLAPRVRPSCSAWCTRRNRRETFARHGARPAVRRPAHQPCRIRPTAPSVRRSRLPWPLEPSPVAQRILLWRFPAWLDPSRTRTAMPWGWFTSQAAPVAKVLLAALALRSTAAARSCSASVTPRPWPFGSRTTSQSGSGVCQRSSPHQGSAATG